MTGRYGLNRSAVQVLTGILLQGGEGKLTLAATDMEVSLRAAVTGEVTGDGAVVVPGRLLTDLARLLPDSSVMLAYDEGEGVLGVTSGSYSSKVNVFSAEDFPRLPALDGQPPSFSACRSPTSAKLKTPTAPPPQ